MSESTPHEEVVCVARGTPVVVRLWQQRLHENGVSSRVLGDDLNASVGTALTDATELWVRQHDAEKAAELIAAAEAEEAAREQRRGD